ncbi:hypothetical protein cypCar_00027552 [Cyprinus carpio]|nr:hypothetical protein cypCar_00027552 [Cyprinus carpio]
MSCITDCWNQEDQKRVYSCPQCRQTFSLRPALNKSTMLAEVVEQLKKTELQTAVPAGPGDVECDVCTVRKHKAVKSCLVCLNSFCQNHLEQHENLFKGKRHDLMDATGRLQEMICCKHEKLLEIYCRTDQRCICLLCMVDEHKNHETVSTAAERTEKQRQLDETWREFQQQIQEREKKLQELKEAVETHKSFPSLSEPPGSPDVPSITFSSYDDVEQSVSKLRQKLEDFCRQEIEKISGKVEAQERAIQRLTLLRQLEVATEQLRERSRQQEDFKRKNMSE